MEKLDFNHIRDLIIKGNVREALDVLLDTLQDSRKLHGRLRDDVILLRTHLNEIERKENLNLISLDDAGRERAHLQKGILDVINSLEEPSYAPAVRVATDTSTSGKWLRWAAGMLAVLLLIAGVVFLGKIFNSAGDAIPVKTSQPAPLPIEPVGPPSSDTGVTPPREPAGSGSKPPADLALLDWQFNPDPPVQQQQTRIIITVQNKGETSAKGFKVEWWAGINFPAPEKIWTLSLSAGQRRQLTYDYKGYSSSYGQLETKIVLDPEGTIRDADRSDNEVVRQISVQKKASDTNVALFALPIPIPPEFNASAYYLLHQYSGKYMCTSSVDNGSLIQILGPVLPGQESRCQFKIIKSEVTGYYYLLNEFSGKYMCSGGKENNAAFHIYGPIPPGHEPSYRFQIVPAELPGYYYLIHEYSKKYVCTGSSENGGHFHTWGPIPAGHESRYRFKIIDASNK